MASQTEPITIFDVPNYSGEVFYFGATYGKSPVTSLAASRNGFRVVEGSQYAMGNFITGDTAAANAVTEDASIAAMTYRSYAAAQKTNYMQIWNRQYAVSYARQALAGQQSGVNINGEPLAAVGSMPVQRRAHMLQLAADVEFSCLRGAATQAWTNAATAGATSGLVTMVEAGSETAAGGATLSKSLIATEAARMAAAGAEFTDIVVTGNAHQIQVLNDLYGFAEQSRTVGGVNLNTVVIPLLGQCSVVYNPVLATDDLVFIDMEHFRVCVGNVPGKPAGVVVEPISQIAAGDYEHLFFLFGIDFDDIHFHGMVSGLATS